MKRTVITTREISDLFGKQHRVLLDKVRELLEFGAGDISAMGLFTESEYKTSQNKNLLCYEMGVDGFCLITDTWSFSRGDSAIVKAKILKEFGESFTVTGHVRNRFEDDYYSMLSEVFHMERIIRQFPVSGYKADFYFPEYGFFVEYDEEGHFSKSAKEKDDEREAAIIKFFKDKLDDTVTIVRVRKGCEFRSISEIAGHIALLSSNGMSITKYAGD